MKQAINIIFDGPPSHESGRFVEVETDDGKSIKIGEWIQKRVGYWALRITELPDLPPNKKLNPKQAKPCLVAHMCGVYIDDKCGPWCRSYTPED